MVLPKYYICPMSKNIVDAVLELNDSRFGLLPTRRQIDFNNGYVNGWNTKNNSCFDIDQTFFEVTIRTNTTS